jgi:serine protease AprX
MEKNKPLIWLCVGFLSLQITFAQDTKRYLVYFKDKANNPYSLQEPQKFLSERALQRRQKQQIALTQRDLPVNPSYVQSLQNQVVRLWYTSKWLNAAMVETDEASLEKLKKLNFLKPEITLLTPRKAPNPKTTATNEQAHKAENPAKSLAINDISDYGNAANQIKMLEADQMHQKGFRGQGMWIAVFDSGFENAPKQPYFQHLYENNRILGTYNFVENIANVYHVGSHGLQVLSTIAAYQKGKIIGTAPEASFFLCRTEDTSSEYRVEEVNWLIAAEKVDSLGIDVINSSLGYNTFNDASMDYTPTTLDGNTALVTKAADWAAATGILVVNSAGNEGNDDWKYISTPADADSILTVGATDRMGRYIGFSSIGLENAQKLKPNVATQGSMVLVGLTNGSTGLNSGTSFSSPLIAGFVSSFWQAFPQLSSQEIIKIIQESANQAHKPDNMLGYGIPNFTKAYALAQAKSKEKSSPHPPIKKEKPKVKPEN